MSGHPCFRLAHGWRLKRSTDADQLVGEWIRPAVRAVPASIASLLPVCEIQLRARISPRNPASRWTLRHDVLEIAVATDGVEPHDVPLEVFVCIGQALWDVIEPDECTRWLKVVEGEVDDLVTGDIDEQAFAAKRDLFSSAASARSPRLIASYARASFAGTVAEYIHSLWHDVTVRTGPEHLPSRHLRRRLELMERWFPPNRGYRLFPEDRARVDCGYEP